MYVKHYEIFICLVSVVVQDEVIKQEDKRAIKSGLEVVKGQGSTVHSFGRQEIIMVFIIPSALLIYEYLCTSFCQI